MSNAAPPASGNSAASTLKLPAEVLEYFPYGAARPHQDEFITTVNKAVNEHKSVLIEGANGLGKTISSLSAVLPVAMKKNLKILYVARTHRQHDRVIDELRAVYKRHPVTGVSIRGRNEMCLNPFAEEGAYDSKSLMEVCELLKSKGRCPYYRNVENRSYEYLQLSAQVAMRPYMGSEILRVCKKTEICPYELVKAAIHDARVIALSYLYVFDPQIRSAFLKNLETELSKIILVVDEAHNLPETAVDISSSQLSLFVLRQAEMEAERFDYKDIEEFTYYFRNEIDRLTDKIRKEELISPDCILEIVKKGGITKPRVFFAHMHEAGVAIKKALLAEGKHPRSYINATADFLTKWLDTVNDKSYINVASRYVNKEGHKTAKLEIVALDPAKITEPVFSQTYANVIMSGTLQPLEAYARITKLPETTVQFLAPSPFPKEHIFSAVCMGVSTSMEQRTPKMYQTMIDRINEVVNSTPTNTGIFAASFQVLNALLSEGLEEQLLKPLYYEKNGMSSKENEKLVQNFKACGDKGGAVFLGVQGGRTSEGVDFPGNQMNSVIIVGVPYAEPTPRVQAQIDYYEDRFPNRGREYGYVLPAMKKACQAAGRPIRTLEDRGAIIFLDHRYASAYLKSFMPSWVANGMKIIPDKPGALAEEVRKFFSAQT